MHVEKGQLFYDFSLSYSSESPDCGIKNFDKGWKEVLTFRQYKRIGILGVVHKYYASQVGIIMWIAKWVPHIQSRPDAFVIEKGKE